MIGLVLLCKQVVERLRLYETSILDVDLCVEFARAFRYLDDLKTFFELIWNVCSLTTSSLVSIKVVWNLTFRRPLLYRIQPLLSLRQSPPSDRLHQSFRQQNQYADHETGVYYNFFRYYEPDAALPKWIAYGVLGAAATGVVALSESITCTGKCQEEKNVRNF